MVRELLLVTWLFAQAPNPGPFDRPQLCEEEWFNRGLQGRVLAADSMDAQALTTAAAQIARSFGHKVEAMRVEVIDLHDAFAVHFASREEGALGHDITVIFKEDNSLCVLRDSD